MAYFARLDGNNQVVDVITIADADADTEANGIAKARELTNTGSAVWKGRKVNPNTDYYNLPWEKEAYRMETCLTNSVWVNNVI